MDIRDWLLGRWDPTRQWVADPRVRAELDLDRHSLYGIRLNDPVEFISRLGPPDNPRPTHHEMYRYHRLGFFFDVDRRAITTFTVVFRPNKTTDEMSAFRGTVLRAGREIDLGAGSSEAEFISEFGPPYWQDREDDDDVVLFYEFGGIEWQVEFSPGGTLDVLIVTTLPTLADPLQRECLRIDKPWPPRT